MPPTVLPPDEKAVNIMEKSRSVQLNDEDLDPEIMVHKSRAEFCVAIGECVRKQPLKRSTSDQIPKSGHSVGRFEMVPVQRESFLSEKEVNSQEVFSSVISDHSGPYSRSCNSESWKISYHLFSAVQHENSHLGRDFDLVTLAGASDVAFIPVEDNWSVNVFTYYGVYFRLLIILLFVFQLQL